MSDELETSEHLSHETNYSLYCINMFGTGLNSIKDELKRQILSGLRQAVYLLDLDDIQAEPNDQTIKGKALEESSNLRFMSSILQHIEEFRKQHETQTQMTKEEVNFDLYQYWLKKNGNNSKINNTKEKVNSKIKDNKPARQAKEAKNIKRTSKIACSRTLRVKKHNRLGQPKYLSSGKFIKDEPILGKMYIIIIGQMGAPFYMDLLRQNQPLEAIINFTPKESNYDIMLGNNKLHNFIVTTNEAIDSSIYDLRQKTIMKPVGVFNHQLPIISNCLATKHSREIFDQLTWSIYDVDVLKQQYEKYYFKPFQVVDVEMPATVNLTQLNHVLESIALQGQFQKYLLPTSSADFASIAIYLNGLLNACSLENDSLQADFVNKSHHLFSTITKFEDYSRLIVAENNKLLLNMLQYTDLDKRQSISLCCLDYYAFGPTIRQMESHTGNSINGNPNSDCSLLTLPKYAKYYPESDCIGQRITELIKEYDEYQVLDFAPGYKLYTFKTNYNILNEKVSNFIIPTRLCFRDFTLFQMDDFLKCLKNVELNTSANSDTGLRAIEFDENIFIRPKSLKASFSRIKKPSKENDNQISESSSNTSRPFSSKSGTKIEKEGLGLPPDHHLLKGYNLDDTLQKVTCKTSKYNYRYGFVKLYEENVCFEDTNKQLTLSVNQATLFCSRPCHPGEGISNNMHIITKNNINIRILNDVNEHSKVVIHYPNGLNVLQHETYCEQVWYSEETPQNEKRRIFTNFGAVIVFFRANNVIIIMRYNGEVYKLYQQEELVKKDVEERDSLLRDHNSPKHSNIQNVETTAGTGYSENISNDEFSKSSTSAKTSDHNLKTAASCELKFLKFLCALHNLTYSNVIITTSQGKIINLTQQGEIFEGPQCSAHEWHDYFANESYCERSDGVKLIWTLNSFKCLHADGTVFTTAIEDDGLEANFNELESQNSISASSDKLFQEMEDSELSASNREIDDYLTQLEINAEKSVLCVIRVFPASILFLIFKTFTSNHSATASTESSQEYVPQDIQILEYKCKSWFIEHPSYAALKSQNSNLKNLLPLMEIFGPDNTRIYISVEEAIGYNVGEKNSLRSEFKTNVKFIVNVKIGDYFHVAASEEDCEIYATLMQPSNVAKETKSDSLALSFKYTDCINAVFKYMVNKISSFGNCRGKEDLDELYFVIKMYNDTSVRGFEFFNALPLTSNYSHRVSNNITELRAVNTISESMKHNCEGHNTDFNKFPRFKQKQQKKTCFQVQDDLPQVLSANLFIEIPKQLLSLTNITTFLEPFENIHFKRLRGKFKNVLNYYLKPEQQFHLKTISSSINWKKRQREHERRIFIEKQRLGLYVAMNKHNIYPNYWKFTQTYGNELSHVDFFEFMQSQCENKKRENLNLWQQ